MRYDASREDEFSYTEADKPECVANLQPKADREDNPKRIADSKNISDEAIRQRLYWVANASGARLEGRSRTERSYQQLTGTDSLVDWIYCRDNKYRPIKSGIAALVTRSAGGMVHSGDQGKEDIKPNESDEAQAMRIRGYGNAIVAGCAIEFISAFMEYGK